LEQRRILKERARARNAVVKNKLRGPIDTEELLLVIVLSYCESWIFFKLRSLIIVVSVSGFCISAQGPKERRRGVVLI
jgi:hypothetical protein